MPKTLFLSAVLIFATVAFSQKERKTFLVKKISESIIADGNLDEPIWEMADIASEFWEYFPTDSIQARKQSQIKILYDDKNLYIGIKAYSSGKNYATQSLQRDFRGSGSDSFSLVFDTFNDGTNAFLFGINPYGVRREALVANGGTGQDDFNLSWDVKWKGDAKIYDDYFTAEMIIPLTSLKFEEGATKWRFNSYRIETQSNERSSWTRIPQNQQIYNLAFMGDMVFEKPLGKSRTPLALIPYVNGITARDFDSGENLDNIKVGADAKISIGNSLNLDLTLNPDFSTVEVDNFITNLTRFEVALPERRQFFIDNNDLFASFGDGFDVSPFFSRRIGIAQDTVGNTIENNLIGGVRLSGKVTNDLRIGVLNIQTAEDLENEIPSNNNTMLAFQQRVFSRSNIGAFFINKQSFKDYNFSEPSDAYNRVLGIDYNLASKNNTWNGKIFTHKSFQPGDNAGNFASGVSIRYNTRKFSVFSKSIFIDEDFRSDLGFVRRTDIFKQILSIERVFWPRKGIVQNHSIQFFPNIRWSPSRNFQNTDYDFRGRYEIQFNNQSQARIEFTNTYTYLFDDFDPTGTEGAIPLPGELEYHYNNAELGYQSDQRKLFSYNIRSTVGRFFNGNRFSLEGRMVMRFQPKALLSMTFNYDQIDLPEPFPSAAIWLISPKIDITFSKSLFWSTLVQYSNQRDNLGINSRLQWRFAPLSDLFLVYNDNYSVSIIEPKFRSINLKLSYWLNI
ncbi:DUF5916 domain-containing protein [Maribacter sp. PR1]|uniref:DUF5916 domain-containing protein n=1 Tax=Maribacter cobaltidurans TaxID=1178778 RepID=A0ABU7IX46_9FLAO|nr:MULTISPECIES: DUF5916 domain-containing protein [Maribacter]MDC6390070.1 DUF5916 domain-containing protein [Maribacter sp. PR1]MEE1977460.1 DUF5916 domain-containing protein [Maribacter cobaltidurans]